MSDLTDELNEIGSTLNHWPAIVEAARRVANPDLIAARDRITPIIAEMLDDRGVIECAVVARIAVHAALGITEDE